MNCINRSVDAFARYGQPVISSVCGMFAGALLSIPFAPLKSCDNYSPLYSISLFAIGTIAWTADMHSNALYQETPDDLQARILEELSPLDRRLQSIWAQTSYIAHLLSGVSIGTGLFIIYGKTLQCTTSTAAYPYIIGGLSALETAFNLYNYTVAFNALNHIHEDIANPPIDPHPGQIAPA